MKKKALWKKRVALLLTAALLAGETGSFSAVSYAANRDGLADSETQQEIEEILPIPEEYLTLGEEGTSDGNAQDFVLPENANADKESARSGRGEGESPSEEDIQKIIPVIAPGDLEESEDEQKEGASPQEEQADLPETQFISNPYMTDDEMLASETVGDDGNQSDDTLGDATDGSSDSVSANEIELDEVYQVGVNDNNFAGIYVSYTPEEDGYYGIMMERSAGEDGYWPYIQWTTSVDDGQIKSHSLKDYVPYVNYMEAGRTYKIRCASDSYLPQGWAWDYKLVKATALNVHDGIAEGMAGELAVANLSLEEDGQLYLGLDSESGFTYQYFFDLENYAQFFSQLRPNSTNSAQVWRANKGESLIYLWRGVQPDGQKPGAAEDYLKLNYQLILFNEYNLQNKTQPVNVYKTYAYTSSDYSYYDYRIVMTVKPEEDGEYCFNCDYLNNYGNAYVQTLYDKEGNYADNTWMSNIQSRTAVVATLEAGKTYYYSANVVLSEYDTSIPNEVNVSIVRVEEQKIETGKVNNINLTTGAILSFDSKKDKFYRVTLKSADVNDKYRMYCDNNAMQMWNINGEYVDCMGKIIYATQDNFKIMIDKDISNGTEGNVTVETEEYIPAEMKVDAILTNQKATVPYEGFLTSFTPESADTYSFWGIRYAEGWTSNCCYVMTKNAGGYFNAIPSVNDSWGYYYVEFDNQYDLEAGKTYYLYQTTDSAADVEDYLVSVSKAENYFYDFSEDDNAVFDIGLYKSAKLQLHVDKAGFYEIEIAGGAEAYQVICPSGQIDGYPYNQTITLYKNQPKQVYLSSAGDYTFQISREFKKNDAADNVHVSLKKCNALKGVTLCSKKTDEGTQVVLREPEDYQWLSFIALQGGYYTFTTEYPRTDDYDSISCQYYRETEDGLSYFRDTAYGIEIGQGETIYLRAYTGDDSAEAVIKAVKYAEEEIKPDTDKTIQYSGRVRLNVDIPETGIYNIKLTGTKQERYNVKVLNNSWYSFYGSNMCLFYLIKGRNTIVVEGELFTESSFTMNISWKESYNVTSGTKLEIPAKEFDNTIWVKYVADKTEYKLIGVENPNDEAEIDWIDVYKLTDGDFLTSSYSEQGSYSKNVTYTIKEFEEGKTYFFKLNMDLYGEAALPITVYEESVPYVTTSLDTTVTLNEMRKVAKVNLSGNDYPMGWYKICITGKGDNTVWNVRTNNGTRINTVSGKETYIEQPYKGALQLTILNFDAQGAEDVTVNVSEYTDNPTPISVNQKIQVAAASDMECYSFTVPKNGRYKMKLTGISYLTYKLNDEEFTKWWYDDTEIFNKDDILTLYVANQKGTEYQFSIEDVERKYFFDFEKYNAFIASGGSVTLKNRNDMTEGDYDYGDWWNYDGNQYLVISSENFKEAYTNDRWLIYPVSYDDFVASYDTYGDFKEYARGMIPEGKILEGIYKTNGAKTADTDKVTEPVMLLNVLPKYVWIQRITITGVSALKPGESATLKANLDTMNQYTPTDSSVTWKSSNSNIVSVDQSGKITAKGSGTATITVTSNDGLHRSASLAVTVTENAVYVQKVTISGKNQINVGDETQLTAALDTNGKGKPSRDGVTWSSSNAAVATVDASGKVKGISAGTAVITAASNDGKASANFTITVSNVVETKIKLNEKSILMKKGTTYKWLEVTFNPKNTTDKTLKWTTSNKKIATVNSKGVITAKGIGKATVTVTSKNGKRASVKVTVTKNAVKVTKLKLPSKKSLIVGDTETLDLVVNPINATNQKVKWKSSNEKVATVDGKGKVTAKQAGKATITVTAQDGSKKSAKCTITVKELSKPGGIKVSSSEGKTAQISWKKVDGADGYNIYMATSKKGSYKKIGSAKAADTSFTKKQLSSKKTYYFKVAAYKKAGKKTYEGKFSDAKSVKVK